MSTIKAKIKLITPPKEIERRILDTIGKHLSQNLTRVEGDIQASLTNMLFQALTGSQETQSIVAGQLRSELGIVDADEQLSQIFTAIVHATKVKFEKPKIRGTKLAMSIIVTAVPFDLSSITGANGKYTTEKGTEIDWFKWLTELGDAVIVRKHESSAEFPSKSRTGDKIMIKGKGWRVPPEFAGTAQDNFVTRATDKILPDLEKYIIKMISRKIGE